MADNKSFLDSNSIQNSIDIKSYFFKILRYWQLFLVTVTIALIIARFMNGYKQKRYSLSTMISVKEENNPLFSTGTNLTFNWGGASDLLETVKVVLNSRSHNEKVVSKLRFYVNYLQEGRYFLEDVYGMTPFKIDIDTSKYFIGNTLIKLEVLDRKKISASFNFSESGSHVLYNYGQSNNIGYQSKDATFYKEYHVDSIVSSPFFTFKIEELDVLTKGQQFYVSFGNFDSVVGGYRGVRVTNVTSGSSLLNLQLQGGNKNRIVDYLNESVKILAATKREQKILYATNTKDYIDKLLKKESDSLKDLAVELGNYKKKNNIYDLSLEGEEVFAQTLSIAKEIREINNSLDDLNALESYLRSNTVYDSNIPVPASVRVADTKIPSGINELIVKSRLRETLKATVTPNHPEYKKIENQIRLTKDILFENIANNKTSYNKVKISLERSLAGYNSKLNALPQKEQDLLKIQRNYDIFEANYTLLKQKSYEAGTAIAANVSDVKVIDTAVDLGEGPIYPKPKFNYMVALMLGVIFPLFYIIIRELLDNKIHLVEDIEKRYSIPVLGVVGRNRNANNLAVFDRPKSSVAESFRAIRSNVQFLFKNDESKRAKTLLLTSSVSGEGKTMVSINMATVFALSGKKTVLVGLDLRKPKIF